MSKFNRKHKITAILVSTFVFFLVAFIALEFFLRKAREKETFGYFGEFKIYNSKFVAAHPKNFNHWPFKLETFPAETQNPVYLFKPNLKLNYRNGRFHEARDGEEVDWSSNNWGFRGREFSMPKKKNVYRVVCLGSSITEGSGSTEASYPAVLHSLLSKIRSPVIEVINAGHHGTRLNESLIELFRLRVLPIEPDLVIVHAGPQLDLTAFSNPPLDCATGFPSGDCWLHNLPSGFRWIIHNFISIQRLTKIFGIEKQSPVPKKHSFDLNNNKNDADFLKTHIAALAALARTHHVKLILTSVPFLADKNLDFPAIKNPGAYQEIHFENFPYTAAEQASAFDYFNELIRKKAKEENLLFVDLASVIPHDTNFYSYDSRHLTDAGYRVVAEHLARFIRTNILKHL